MINLACSAYSRLEFWSRREMLWCTKGRENQAVVCSILLNGCEIWPVREADERMLEFLDSNSNRRILRVRRRNCAPSVDQRFRLWHCSCKEGSAGLDMPKDVPKVNSSRTLSFHTASHMAQTS